ncbi:hypothetical protein H4R33_004123 [Dimargaris cristalligena]|uniref:G-protein coupled receptors family 1 profile domain-containing protein n=1 Tax=Dimargaris cristalligena TaxID=215637 RepID=A0A4P9ZTS2_9FUNG|nr:hypothetical protein H4R33_004123 [Dimargaris cristalligena]RKP36608.1 hypothetical protein BJ085DRAFT_35750 [Dimargaris cristalligena]|eukprot:RKP36608.1 hypothetical protein BJ085DRAFT_35750 [Dimargaris cristalligena]
MDMNIPLSALWNLQLFRITGGLMMLIMCHNLYHSWFILVRKRQLLHILCFLMNLILTTLTLFVLLRDHLQLSCNVYTGLFFSCHTVSVAFSGVILLVKAYYASGKSNLVLYGLIVIHTVSVATNIYAETQIGVMYRPETTLCGNEISLPSFITSVATEFLFNLVVTFTFLIYIIRAYRRFSSNLYAVLVRDGMVAWIGTAICRGVLAFTLFKSVNSLAVVFISISVLATSCIITLQLRHTLGKNRR